MALPPKIFALAPWLQVLGDQYETFRELIRALVTTKRMSQNFCFGDLRSGQCRDLTITRRLKNVEMPFVPKVPAGARYVSQDIIVLGHSR